MPILVVESEWREIGMRCVGLGGACGGMLYSDGKHRPQCPDCLRAPTDEEIWTWLITLHDDKELQQ